jgi:hypothetical protein
VLRLYPAYGVPSVDWHTEANRGILA